MYTVTIKKAGKQVWKGYQSDLMQAALWAKEAVRDNAWDEIIIKKPVVAVLPTQAEIEALGKKD